MWTCRFKWLLCDQADGLAPYSEFPHALQLTAELPPYPARSTVDGREEINVAFLDCDVPEGQDLHADSATGVFLSIRDYAHRDLAYSPAETSEPEPQPPLDIGFDSLSKTSLRDVHSNLHSILLA
jgi:hypothetical protein